MAGGAFILSLYLRLGDDFWPQTENFLATGTHRLTLLYGPVYAAVEDIHARVWVGPSVAKGGGIEIAQVLLHLGNDQKPRPFRNQKPNGKLNGCHVIDQAKARQEPKKV